MTTTTKESGESEMVTVPVGRYGPDGDRRVLISFAGRKLLMGPRVGRSICTLYEVPGGFRVHVESIVLGVEEESRGTTSYLACVHGRTCPRNLDHAGRCHETVLRREDVMQRWRSLAMAAGMVWVEPRPEVGA